MALTAAVRADERRRALLEVPRLDVVLGDAAHRQRVDAVRVAVTRARVHATAAVTRRPHEDRSAPATALQCTERNVRSAKV